LTITKDDRYSYTQSEVIEFLVKLWKKRKGEVKDDDIAHAKATLANGLVRMLQITKSIKEMSSLLNLDSLDSNFISDNFKNPYLTQERRRNMIRIHSNSSIKEILANSIDESDPYYSKEELFDNFTEELNRDIEWFGTNVPIDIVQDKLNFYMSYYAVSLHGVPKEVSDLLDIQFINWCVTAMHYQASLEKNLAKQYLTIKQSYNKSKTLRGKTISRIKAALAGVSDKWLCSRAKEKPFTRAEKIIQEMEKAGDEKPPAPKTIVRNWPGVWEELKQERGIND
jgi:hypothetical protein